MSINRVLLNWQRTLYYCVIKL